jgi:hypothetical protein
MFRHDIYLGTWAGVGSEIHLMRLDRERVDW